MSNSADAIPAFQEVQRFRQPWLWAIVLGVAGLFWFGSLSQLLLRRPWGDKPMPDMLLFVLWLVFGIGLPWLFLKASLVTEVREDGLYIRFFPFHRSFRRIPFEALKRYEPRIYRPIREYGGWGIRFSRKGSAYNVSGNRGVQLELAGGKRLLIGSQRPDELAQAIKAKFKGT